MADTFSLPARLPRHRTATGYEKRKHRLRPQSGSPLDGICGSGSFYSTVADLCRYEMALAASRLVAPATMRVALTSGVNRRGRPTGYGFGWGLGTLRGERVAEHSGGWTGFVSHQRRFLDRPLSIYVLSNNDRLEPSRITDAATGIFW
jgi:CubicO group peptidase (beta-lactamase class C family)